MHANRITQSVHCVEKSLNERSFFESVGFIYKPYQKVRSTTCMNPAFTT